jgi:hypothetical protein
VVGALHAILSASIYFNSSGPPLAIAVLLTLLPALVALSAALALPDMRSKARAQGLPPPVRWNWGVIWCGDS